MNLIQTLLNLEFTKLHINTVSATQSSPQLTQWRPRWHHALELRLDHRRRSLELGGSVVDEELHRDIVQCREGRLILCGVLAVF